MLTGIYPCYKRSTAFKESLAIYMVLTVFILLGTGSLYASANVTSSPNILLTFLTGICLVLGFLIYLIPRYHHMLFRLGFSSTLQLILIILASSGGVCGVAVWFVDPSQYLWVLAPVIILLIAAVIYCQTIYLRYYQRAFSSTKPKIISTIFPIACIAMGLTEGLFFHETLIGAGMTLSLPLIYLLNNLITWHFRNELFPAPQSLKIPDSLTPKEQEIVQHVYTGLSNKQIAYEMNISPSTVKNHLYNVFKKLGVSNRVALLSSISHH
jgi:DNA-binding CsgD family transcriptional regulator